MRLHKVVNRVHEGTVYYRWVLSIPPKDVEDLGWVDGQELATVVEGSKLSIQKSSRSGAGRRPPAPEALEEAIRRRSFTRQ